MRDVPAVTMKSLSRQLASALADARRSFDRGCALANVNRAPEATSALVACRCRLIEAAEIADALAQWVAVSKKK